jgi:hypothetical protein
MQAPTASDLLQQRLADPTERIVLCTLYALGPILFLFLFLDIIVLSGYCFARHAAC